MFSYALFILACLIPPSIYSHYIEEPDLMFLDSTTILFYSLCVASFLTGAGIVGWLMHPIQSSDEAFTTKISSTTFILIPLLLGMAFTIRSVLTLLKSSPAILLFLFAQQGQSVKNSDLLAGNLTMAPLTLIAIVWWAYWRYSDIRPCGPRKALILIVLWIATLSIILSTILTLSRSLLIVAFSGFAILYMVRKATRGKLSLKFLMGGSITTAVGLCLLFFAFSFLRGADSLDGQIYQIFGYTVASYNRLAAVLNGSLHFPFEGKGIYLSGFFTSNSTFNHVIPLNRFLDIPAPDLMSESAFAAVTRAGLDGTMVWPGAFGDTFADLGWFSCPFILGYGMLYGVAWNWLRRGKTLGVVLYPYFSFCVLFWIGGNLLLSSDSAVVFVVALLLAGYEMILVKPTQNRVLPLQT
jgi:hypothetical protein